MNNKYKYIRIFAAVISIVIGAALMQVRANLEFFNLIPTDSATHITPIKSESVYRQEITIQRKTLSRLGIYMRPLQEISDASAALRVSILRHNDVIGSGFIPAIFIENGGPSYVTFDNPITTHKGERIIIEISAPEGLSGAIALRQRMYDAQFPRADSIFSINSVPQDQVIAFNMFESIRPALLRQLGGILITLGLALVFLSTLRTYRTMASLSMLSIIALLYAIPAWDASMSYGLFSLAVAALLLCMWALLRIAGRTHFSAMFGAAVFACSTWLPLHIITSGNIGEILSPRNALIDPNQIAITHGAGLYIGMLAGAVASIGIILWLAMIVRGKYKQCEIESIVGVCGALATYIAFIPSPVNNPHAGIAVSFALAWFASFGLWRMQRFLGTTDKLAYSILTILVVITLLDLMYVTARTLTYGLGV